jgi:hypothetical protein
VSAIVAAHGGTVTAVGEPGRGTRFTVHLPVPPPRPDGVADGQADLPIQATPSDPPTPPAPESTPAASDTSNSRLPT